MSSRPSAFNSDLYVNGDPSWPVFDEGYSKFEVTEKRMDSDDVICLPASQVRAVCPDLMPKPMPRPVPGCPPNYGPIYQSGGGSGGGGNRYPGTNVSAGQYYPGQRPGQRPGGSWGGGGFGDYEEKDQFFGDSFGPNGHFGDSYGPNGQLYDPRDPVGGDRPTRRPTPRPTKKPAGTAKPVSQLLRSDGMYHGRHVTSRGLRKMNFSTHTLVSPKAKGGALRVALQKTKGNTITQISLGSRKFTVGNKNASIVTGAAMAVNVPFGFHTNTNKINEGGMIKDPANRSTSKSKAQFGDPKKTTVYTRTHGAYYIPPRSTVRGRKVLNTKLVSDVAIEKRIKMLGNNAFSYGVTMNYPKNHDWATTRTSVVKSVAPSGLSRITALTRGGRWIKVPLSTRRRYLTVISYQALALSTADGKYSIGLSLHDFPKSSAGNWFKPVTLYSVRKMRAGISWSVIQQLGRRNAVNKRWETVKGGKRRQVRRSRVLPNGKFSYGMTWAVGSMAVVQSSLLRAAQTKGRDANSNIVDTEQTVRVCVPKKKQSARCRLLKCKKNDKRKVCATNKCMACTEVKVTPKGQVTRVCKPVNTPKCAGCKVGDKRAKCKNCTKCTNVVKPAAAAGKCKKFRMKMNPRCKDAKCTNVNDKRKVCKGCIMCADPVTPKPTAAAAAASKNCRVKQNERCKKPKCKVNDKRKECKDCTVCDK